MRSCYDQLKLYIHSRKGLDKPIFIVASLTLALLFVALIYTASSGWFNDALNSFLGSIGEVSVGSGDGS